MKKKFIVIPAIIALGVGGFFFMKSRLIRVHLYLQQ